MILIFYMKFGIHSRTFYPDRLPKDHHRVRPSPRSPQKCLRYDLAYDDHRVSITLSNSNLLSRSRFFLDIFSPHSGLLFLPS